MPTLALPPPPLPAFVIQAGEWSEYASRGNGREAHRLTKLVGKALAHWSERAEVLVASIESDDDVSYEHLLPRPSFVVKVRYNAVGRLQPRRFEIDD